MSFVSYEDYMSKALQGPGITMDMLFNIGDIVDSKIIDSFRDDMPPTYDSNSLFQMGEAYIYSKDSEGVSRPCYITFSFENNDWVFCGACFEKSTLNRCEAFEYATPTVAQYCVDKYHSEYVRAAERYYVDEQSGKDVSNLLILDDYMKFNPFVLAGYYIDTYSVKALETFKEIMKSYQSDMLYEPVVKLLEQSDTAISREIMFLSQQVDSVSSLIANATERTSVHNNIPVVKADVDFEM